MIYYSMAVKFWKYLSYTKTNSKNIFKLTFEKYRIKKSTFQMSHCIYNI